MKLTTFKYEGVKEAKVYAANKCYAFKFKVNYYIFTCLPFGLSSACYIFIKVVRPLDTFWWSKGFLTVVYQDDGLVFEDSEESWFKVSKEALSDLLSVGFLPNYEKSVWKPKISIDWLGFVWDADKENVRYFTVVKYVFRKFKAVNC